MSSQDQSAAAVPAFGSQQWGKGGHITSRVLAILGCSATELERWSSDGRLTEWGWVRISLPHTSKKVDARVWGLPDLMVAAHLVDDWRVLDKASGKRPAPGKPRTFLGEDAIPTGTGLPGAGALGMPMGDAIKRVADIARSRGYALSTRQVWLAICALVARYGRMPAERTVLTTLTRLLAPPKLTDATAAKAALKAALAGSGLRDVRVTHVPSGGLAWSATMRVASERHGIPFRIDVGLRGEKSAVVLSEGPDVAMPEGFEQQVADEMAKASPGLSAIARASFDRGLTELIAVDVAPTAAMRLVAKAFTGLPLLDLASCKVALGSQLDARLTALREREVRPLLGKRIRSACGFTRFPDLYPLARVMGRRHLVLVGPTNSGKTHRALGLAGEATNAVVLSPLRLLALEHMEAMRSSGLAAGLMTGEEKDIPEGTTHLAQTIETMDAGRVVDVAVVDEGQMLCDRERGWAWTRAIAGVPAKLVVTTGSPEIADHVRRLAALCGEPCEVVRLDRLGSLESAKEPVEFGRIKPGDAIIAFSRRDVLQLRDRLQSQGIKAAAVYGGLGPEVRRAEAERFRSGQAKVIVATDAIGMGLNLPVSRVILTAVTKYDGVKVRRLTFPEARQILGRAGRHGLAESGVAAAMTQDGLDFVRTVLATEPTKPRLARFPVRPDPATVELAAGALGTKSLTKALTYLRDNMTAGSKEFEVGELSETLQRSIRFDGLNLSISDRYAYANCPCQDDSLYLVQEWARTHAKGSANGYPQQEAAGRLQDLENSSKLLTTYLWLARHFPDAYPEAEAAAARRVLVDAGIVRALTSGRPAWENRAPTRGWRDWEEEDHYAYDDDDSDDDDDGYEDRSGRRQIPVKSKAAVHAEKAARKRARNKRKKERRRERDRLAAASSGSAPVVANIGTG